ncbi:Spermidine synthase-like protein [Burkholderiales bacterium]|nr:Spermidine synthase-like protein [Burkholderiales bacterium]
MNPVIPSRRLAPAAGRVLAALYFFSGATGLGYEVLWARMLSAQFGVSIFGVAATVTAFLLGLGIGSMLAAGGPRIASAARALQIFALLELTIALYALALPAIVAAGAPVLETLAAQLNWWQWFGVQAAVALILLALPAAAMGASFPMVLGAFAWTPQLLGQVYGINCLGAAAGALLSLALLAELGWSYALDAIAACGVLIASAAGLLSCGASWQSAETPAPASREQPARLPQRLLLAYAAVGACALMLEIAWTRLYGMVMLRTEYVLAIILAVYLFGTALGSLLAARAQHGRWLRTAVPLVACGWTLLGLWILPTFSVWVQEQRFASLPSALVCQALALGLCTLPTTAALGAWLPMLAHRIDAGAARRSHGVWLYGANCIGAAAGAGFTVLIAIPQLGTTASIALAAVLLLVLGLALGTPRALLAALPLAIAVAWSLREFPTPRQMLPPSAPPTEQLYRYEDALSLNHVTQAGDGQRTLLTDLRHMDASSDPAAVQIQADQARLPLLLHRGPRSVLFLGLGTGISASGSLAYPDLERTAVELSPGAIWAARTWFAPVNHDIVRTMRIEHDDARHYLAAHRGKFDVIVGDLFHPDLAGMSNLLSIEQFQRAREHLRPDGIFAQWIALNQFDIESLHTVLRSFQRVFPDAQIFLDGMHLAMIGSPAPLADGAALSANLAGRTSDQADAATGAEGAATWLGRYWGRIGAGIGPVQSESRPVIEYRLPRLRYLEQMPLADVLLDLLRRRPDLETARTQLGIVPGQQQASFASAYVASELAVQSWVASFSGDTTRAGELTRLAFETNPRDRWVASALADELFDTAAQNHALEDRATLDRILRIYPDQVEALRALWHLERASGRADASRVLARLRGVAPLDREVLAAGGDAPQENRNGN